MIRSFIAGVILSGLVGVGGIAAAQTTTPPSAPAATTAPMPRGAKMIERLCGAPVKMLSDRYANGLAERLSLNDAQKALLKSWQDARQKARTDARATLCAPKPDLSTFAGRLDWRGKRLETRLATFRAERPKLESFYASLDARQKASWDEMRGRQDERRQHRRHERD